MFKVLLLISFVVFTAGCMKNANPGGLLLWLEIPSHVSIGETVPLILKLKNISSHPIVLGHASPAYNFIVTRSDGTEVWRWATGTLDLVLSTTVNAGEEVEFTAEWDQRELRWDDQGGPIKGNPVPPGTYWVQGIFHGNILEKVYQGGTEYLKSKPKQLVIMPTVGVLPQKDMPNKSASSPERYDVRATSSRSMAAEKKERVFRLDAFDPRLGAHKLKGKLRGLWAFSVTRDIRIIFEFLNSDEVLFHDIGPHSTVYGKSKLRR